MTIHTRTHTEGMYYLALTDYSGHLPPGVALLEEERVLAYIATDNRQCAQLNRTLKMIERYSVGRQLIIWSAAQQHTLERLLGHPLDAAAELLRCQLELLGYPSLSPAYACARLGLNEPGDDALSQAYALAALHRHLGALPGHGPVAGNPVTGNPLSSSYAV